MPLDNLQPHQVKRLGKLHKLLNSKKNLITKTKNRFIDGRLKLPVSWDTKIPLNAGRPRGIWVQDLRTSQRGFIAEPLGQLTALSSRRSI